MHRPLLQLWKSRMTRWILAVLMLLMILGLGWRYHSTTNWNLSRCIGEPMDSLDGIVVYYNGGVDQSHGRNTAPGGYNVGIRFQCVEFVKRYYFEVFHHQMTDAYGHAKDFFDPLVADGKLNKSRGLIQYKNGGAFRPQHGDLLVWGPSAWNAYGHVAIVDSMVAESKMGQYKMSFVQQNPGPFGASRDSRRFYQQGNHYSIEDDRLLGWLRMPINDVNH